MSWPSRASMRGIAVYVVVMVIGAVVLSLAFGTYDPTWFAVLIVFALAAAIIVKHQGLRSARSSIGPSTPSSPTENDSHS